MRHRVVDSRRTPRRVLAPQIFSKTKKLRAFVIRTL
nr:MAG TPA: hypothetical protein [Caudoviricetes sp.]